MDSNSNQNPKGVSSDAGGIKLDMGILRKNRIMWMMALAQDPRRFYCRGVGVTVEHTEGGPALQDKLTNFFIRQKSGL